MIRGDELPGEEMLINGPMPSNALGISQPCSGNFTAM
jgi:hypothetical protein